MLALESVDIFYGHIQALAAVSISVHDGELVTLLGANGAGKSTALMAVSGIVRPRSGSVRWDDTDLAAATPYAIVGLGVIHCPEGRRIFGGLSVLENLRMGAIRRIFGGLSVLENLRMGAIRRKDRAAARSDMEYVFSLFPVLGERRHQTGATLSGGEQQMLAIGRALMAAPRLLLLDEPSLGLAPLVVKEIFRVIRELHRSGVTILLVEQNVRQALAVADRGYVLSSGSVTLSGTGAELRANPEIEQAYLSRAPEAGQ